MENGGLKTVWKRRQTRTFNHKIILKRVRIPTLALELVQFEG